VVLLGWLQQGSNQSRVLIMRETGSGEGPQGNCTSAHFSVNQKLLQTKAICYFLQSPLSNACRDLVSKLSRSDGVGRARRMLCRAHKEARDKGSIPGVQANWAWLHCRPSGSQTLTLVYHGRKGNPRPAAGSHVDPKPRLPCSLHTEKIPVCS
jgi:hypothetical protein